MYHIKINYIHATPQNVGCFVACKRRFQPFGGFLGFSVSKVMSYIMWPLAFMMGVPQEDCLKVGLLIGHLEFFTWLFLKGFPSDCPYEKVYIYLHFWA